MYEDLVRAAVAIRAQQQQQHDVIEAACEAALQGGEHGVLVIEEADGTVTAEVSATVPYGTLYWGKPGSFA